MTHKPEINIVIYFETITYETDQLFAKKLSMRFCLVKIEMRAELLRDGYRPRQVVFRLAIFGCQLIEAHRCILPPMRANR